MPLSRKHLQDVCLLYGGHKRCRYLAQDDNDWSKYYCVKRGPKKQEIDDEIDELVGDMQMKGQDPRKANIPLGDNCSGYPILKFIEQGYDKDKKS